MSYIVDRMSRSKLPTVVALAALLIATWMDWQWVWGVFFLYWAVLGIMTGQAFVVRTVDQDESPLLFWLISVTWLVVAALSIFYDLFPETARLWLG
ncbi:MAG: hypothetical protein OXK16_09535 [bacterium]|nr:hypothetical protein [bacterium]MDE0376190.1 hypothetical protein [bacterium]